MKVLRLALWHPLVATTHMSSETLPNWGQQSNYKIQSSPWNLKHIGCDWHMTHIRIFPTVGQKIIKTSILLRKFNSAWMILDCVNAFLLCRQCPYGMLLGIFSKMTCLIKIKKDCCTFLFAYHKNQKGKNTAHVPLVTNSFIALFFPLGCTFFKRTEQKKKSPVSSP